MEIFKIVQQFEKSQKIKKRDNKNLKKGTDNVKIGFATVSIWCKSQMPKR